MPLRRPLPAKSRLEAAYPAGRRGTLCQHRAFSRTSIPGREASGDQGYARGGCKAWCGRFLRGVVLELPPGVVLSVMDIYVRDSPGSSTLKHLTDLMDMYRANHRTPL